MFNLCEVDDVELLLFIPLFGEEVDAVKLVELIDESFDDLFVVDDIEVC